LVEYTARLNARIGEIWQRRSSTDQSRT